MDGSERIEYQTTTEPVMEYTISQPQVIVERVVPEDMIVEETVEEQVQHNGDSDVAPPPATATLDDIIADAVGPEDDAAEESANVTEEADAAEEGDTEKSVKKERKDEEEEGAEEAITPSRKKEEPSLDLQQCRCCTARTDLSDIFEPLKRDPTLPLSSVITKLCPKLTITKRDHLPNVICQSCVYKLEIAWEFRVQCEKTDEELRKSLPRAKKISRKRTDYTFIDYESSSGEDAGGNVDDEEEFKLSDELEDDSAASDSEVDSEAALPRKRGRPKKGGRAAGSTPTTPVSVKHVTGTPGTASSRGRGRPGKAATPGTRANPAARAPIVYVESKGGDSESDDDSDDDDDDDFDERPKKRVAQKQCPKCKLVLTKGPHICKIASFSCTFCTEKFATHPLYMNHQQLHTNFQNANGCVRCHRQFPNKAELRKHQSGVRCQKSMNNKCHTCERMMANASHLAIHMRTKCVPVKRPATAAAKVVVKKEGSATPKRGNVVTVKKEKAPMKFEAPKSSTYWSDSFSE